MRVRIVIEGVSKSNNAPEVIGRRLHEHFALHAEASGIELVEISTDVGEAGLASKALTFAEVSAVNRTRANRWHDPNATRIRVVSKELPNGDVVLDADSDAMNDWSVADWAVALTGELGEACNLIKKLRRVEDGIRNEPVDPTSIIGEWDAQKRAELTALIGEELADTYLYLDLLCTRLGIDLTAEVVRKFNVTSERYGFPERLPSDAR